MKYTQTFIMTGVGLGLAGFWIFDDKAVMAHHAPSVKTLTSAVIFLAIAVAAGLFRDRRAYMRRRAGRSSD